MKSSTTKDLTTGPLLPLILKFTIPLLAGSLLQLTYNAADSIIVGRFLGSDSLAAVGTSNPLISLLIMFFQGISIGTGVLTGQYFGAHEEKKLEKQFSTAMLSGCFLSILLAVLVLLFTHPMLHLLKVDPLILSDAVLYLRIIACGIIFNYIYNFYAGVLRAMGNSLSPLLFLAISACLNIAGDLLFILVFPLGIMGCALSTVISEALSCLFCYFYVKKKVPILNLGRKWLVFDPEMLKLTLQYGLTTGIQQCSIQIGILGVQGLVNSLGKTITAAYAAANRIDDYTLIIERNLANAMTSVIAQNHGAGKKDRVRKTFRIATLLSTGYAVFAAFLLFFLSPRLLRIFSNDEAVVANGLIYLRLIAFMYIVPAVTSTMQGYFRGIGKVNIAFIGTVINMSSRFLTCYLLIAHLGMQIGAIPWACLAGWVIMSFYQIPKMGRGLA